MTSTSDAPGEVRAWQRAPRALWRRSSGRIIVLCPGREQPLVLDGTGPAIWELLDSPIEEDELSAVLAQATRSDHAQVARDVRSFIEQLAGEGAIIPGGRDEVDPGSTSTPEDRRA